MIEKPLKRTDNLTFTGIDCICCSKYGKKQQDSVKDIFNELS